MTDAAYLAAETLRTIFYLILFLDLSSRIMPWIGVEDTNAGRAVRSFSELISLPFVRLMRGFTDRHPFFDRMPQALSTVLIYILAVSVP